MLRIELADDEHCQGIEYLVDNVDALAEAVALVLVQEFTLARELVAKVRQKGTPPALGKRDIEDIIQRRLKPVVTYHRDGLMFQLMMWLAAHVDLAPDDIIAVPHSQGSAKGQDSVIVHRASGAVAAVTICEDKATETPRKTVREDVWPEIVAYEDGQRLDELRSIVITTLGTAGIRLEEAQVLVKAISWKGKRRYRVRVTIQEARSKDLFKDFKEHVKGSNEMRRGETVLLPAMRSWMNDLATKTEKCLRGMIEV